MTKTALVGSNVRLLNVRKCMQLLSLLTLLVTSSIQLTANDLLAINIRGRITNGNGQPLAGVSVVVRATNLGTSTNLAGEFQLNGVDENAVLLITYIGHQDQEIRVNGRTVINVVMQEGGKVLEDVVVTGFQRIDRSKFTGAAVKLRAEDVKLEGITDVSRMLEGRAAGVSVQNVSGTFGSAPKVRVRGATSISGENKPLWVVDGVVLEDIINISNDQLSSGDPTTLLSSSVAGLNANDIESFDILKDAAATALYGARAMNGVIVITTKRGKSGTPVISYSGNFSTQLKPRYTEFNIMNSAQQMSVLAELERKGSLTTSILNEGDYGVYGKYYDLVNANSTGQFGIPNTPEAKRAFLLRYATANTDWFDVLFRQSLIQEHNLSISSGSDRSTSFFSSSFYTDNGWTVADNVKRYTLNFRNTYNVSDRLNVGFITTGSYRQQRAPGTVRRVANVVEGKFERDFDINPFSYALNTSRAITAFDSAGNREFFRRNFAPFNILTELENNQLKINVIDLKLQGELGYKFNNDLRYDFIGALRYVRSTREHEVNENSNMANAYRAADNATMRQNNPFLYQDPENPSAEKVVVLPYGGFYNRVEDQLLSFDVRHNLNYVKTFAERHDVNLLLGQQVKYSDRQNFSNTGYGYQFENGGIAAPDFRIIKQAIENNFPYFGMGKDFDRFAAFYFNGQYTYNDKYSLYGTVRYDGTNRLGASKKARWLPTWSFGGLWNLNEEEFIKNISQITFLKLRASYGLTASMGPATNSQIVLRNLNIHRPYTDDVETLIRIANLENSELTWEKNYALNIGVEGGFFKNRLTATVDWYKRNSFDLISTIQTSGIGGESLKAANYADMNSHGVEVAIGGDVIRARDFRWNSRFIFGMNSTRIVNVKNIPRIFDLVKSEGGTKEGYPFSSLFSIKYTGLDSVTGVPYFLDERGKTAQDVYLQDDSTQHLVFEGTIDPKYTGGWNNSFTYKGLTLNVFLTYQAGNVVRLTPAFKSQYVELNGSPREFYDRWVLPGEQRLTNVPSIIDAYQNALIGNQYPFNIYNYSSARVAKGDFVRLKSISLNYLFPESMMKRTGFVKTFSLGLAANNVWLIYSDKRLEGQDPEFFNAGGVAQPIQKQITLSLRAGF
jgi:TonB-linked SusC/RagA family outer membrane protein